MKYELQFENQIYASGPPALKYLKGQGYFILKWLTFIIITKKGIIAARVEPFILVRHLH